jgi:uncharacterized protein involved in exopolysaccharide biosynthesis
VTDSTTQSVERDESLDVRSALHLLFRKRWWIIAAVVVSSVGFATVAFLMRPVYRASIVMISVSSERNNLAGSASSALGQLGGLASIAGLSLGSTDASTAEALGVLHSRQFAEKFIVDENLMPQLFFRSWDPNLQTWKAKVHPVPTLGKAFKYFDKKIRTIVQDNKSGLITLQIDWIDREAAAAWANELVKRLNAEMRARAIAGTDASIAFLEKELTTTSVVEMQGAINRLIEAQEKQRMVATVTEQFAFRVVDAAVAPDADDPVKPPKALLLLAGPLVGLALSIAWVLIFAVGDSNRRTAGIERPSF